jgi:hypothetical protein
LDDLWRNASTIGTILAAAAKLFPMTAPVAASPLMVAALIFLAVTVILSAYTRGPASMAVPTNTRSILAVIESDPPPSKAQVEGVEAASYHFATIGMTRVNLWKSRQTKRATVLFCTGLMFLVLAMLSRARNPLALRPLRWTILRVANEGRRLDQPPDGTTGLRTNFAKQSLTCRLGRRCGRLRSTIVCHC